MFQPEQIIVFIENDQVTVGRRQDDIIHVCFKPNTEITVDLQKELVEMYLKMTDGKKGYFVFEGGEFVSITREARANAILIEEQTPVICSAVVVRNLAQKIIADFYYMVDKPKNPYKVFHQFEKAIEWLNAQKFTEER